MVTVWTERMYDLGYRFILNKASIVQRLLLIFVVAIGFVNGCIISSNYYTAKTVESGHTVFRPGFDNIAIKEHGNPWLISEEDKPLFLPSFGVIRGLPGRFEMGATFILRLS